MKETTKVKNRAYKKETADSLKYTKRKPEPSPQSERMRTAGFLLVLITGLMIFLCIVFTVNAPDIRFDNEDVFAVRDGWTVTAEDITEQVSLPSHIDASAGETVTYSTVLTGDDKVRNSILVRVQHQFVKIYLDGVLLSEFGYRQSSILGEAPYAGWALVRLPDGWPGKTLVIEQIAYYDNYSGLLNAVYIGTKNALVFSVIHKCLVSIVFNITIFLIGVFLFSLSFFSRFGYILRQIRYLSIFAILTSLWLVLESGGYQLLFGKAPLISNLIFILFGMIPVTCLRFLLTYDFFDKNKYLNAVYYLSICTFITQQILQLTRICDYIQSIVLTHLIIILCVAGILGQYISLVIKGKKDARHPVYTSCIVFSGFGLIDIARFYLGSPSDNPVPFSQIGLLLFFLILSHYAIQNSVTEQENRIKQEFFEHMAFTDLLTGIPNRNAFEREMEYYRTSAPGAHPMILIADLNDLKKINDSLGHSSGDSAIITVAQTLLKTFGSSSVYRLGGDEFCVISPEMEEEEAVNRETQFLLELHKAALSNNLPLSIAIGRYKEQGEGIDKAFNRADALMYEYKQKKKSCPETVR